MHTTTIGVDLAKSVFQVSVANRAFRIVERKRLTRSQFERFIAQQAPANVVMEACATANYWSQFAQAHGHHTKLLHALYVKPYVHRNKTDACDADALVAASRDPQLHPVPTKAPAQQALQALHRCRQAMVDTRNRRISLARGILAEFGITLPRRASAIAGKLLSRLDALPPVLLPRVQELITEISDLKERLDHIDHALGDIAKADPVAQRLITIPGVGVVIATAFIASVPDIHIFMRPRQFSAWLGITPREHSSGGKRKLGSISKKGNRYLRMLLIHGARSALLAAHRKAASAPEQLTDLQTWVVSDN